MYIFVGTRRRIAKFAELSLYTVDEEGRVPSPPSSSPDRVSRQTKPSPSQPFPVQSSSPTHFGVQQTTYSSLGDSSRQKKFIQNKTKRYFESQDLNATAPCLKYSTSKKPKPCLKYSAKNKNGACLKSSALVKDKPCLKSCSFEKTSLHTEYTNSSGETHQLQCIGSFTPETTPCPVETKLERKTRCLERRTMSLPEN